METLKGILNGPWKWSILAIAIAALLYLTGNGLFIAEEKAFNAMVTSQNYETLYTLWNLCIIGWKVAYGLAFVMALVAVGLAIKVTSKSG
jgi:membrane protein implicated in regulation of membrane protease activity